MALAEYVIAALFALVFLQSGALLYCAHRMSRTPPSPPGRRDAGAPPFSETTQTPRRPAFLQGRHGTIAPPEPKP